jgi:hypothetical protein
MTDSSKAGADPETTMPRRLLFMIQQLHRLGFQRLRAAPYMAPSGMYWRLAVAPVSNVRRDHGAMVSDSSGAFVLYSTADGAACFKWTDARDDGPEALATKFLDRFPALCEGGKGPDEAYARWYSEMLRTTEPDGLIYAFSDWMDPEDRLPALNISDDVRIPLPPAGEAR